MEKQNVSYLMCIFNSHSGDKIKKCQCGYQISQRDLLKKIYSIGNEFKFYHCDSCKQEIHYMIV